MDHSELDQLAQATFELSKSFKRNFAQYQLGFDFRDPQHDRASEAPVASCEQDQQFPEAAGIVYRLESGTSTFCIRGRAVESIADVMEEIESGNAGWEKTLRLSEDLGEQVSFFETSDKDAAEVLVDQLINKRFPIEEDMLCNLSDPGFSWWLDAGADHLLLHFKSHGIERRQNLLQLGPLGDRRIANARMGQLENWLRSQMNIVEFSSSDVCVSMAVSEGSEEKFSRLKKLFIDGEFLFQRSEFSNESRDQTLFFFLKEMALVRSFWLEIEASLTGHKLAD